jgi:hypothetical protein
MYELETVIDRYFAAWNEANAVTRAALIEQAWSDDGRYCDPLSDVQGHDGFAAMVDGVQEQLPGHRVQRTSPVDRHHDQVRFEWEIVSADGDVALTGVDYAELAADGRLQSVSGFFGTGVAQEAAA